MCSGYHFTFPFLAEHTEHKLPEELSLCSDGKLGPDTQIVFLLPDGMYAVGNKMLSMSKSRTLNVLILLAREHQMCSGVTVS